MKKVDVLLGLQWGDEGKGKIVDFFTPKYDIIARFQGGPNAGHTLEFDGKKYVLNTIPSGIFHDKCINIIGNGVVIDPIILKKEIEQLIAHGIPVHERLLLSNKAHLILPTHPMLDACHEILKGNAKIGSTLKGIAPTYTDKVGRNGLRLGDIKTASYKEKLLNITKAHLDFLNANHFPVNEYPEKLSNWLNAVEYLEEFTWIDAENYIYDALNNNKSVLAEGAQGTLLDIDFGSYPYVTSSNTITAGACTGLGIAPNAIGKVFGIFKAYCTRVGGGPFPTELNDSLGEHLRKKGNEFGSTTGRARRTGWLDLVALKYAIQLNGVTDLIITKADVLSGLAEICVAKSYTIQNNVIHNIPFDLYDVNTVNYDVLPCWPNELNNIKNAADMPAALENYIGYIEKQTSTPITLISVGPDRLQTFTR